MARNDGVDRTSVRNLAVSDKAVGNTQQHNEREKDSYRNPDIIPQRAAWNVHFKKPTASYTDLSSTPVQSMEIILPSRSSSSTQPVAILNLQALSSYFIIIPYPPNLVIGLRSMTRYRSFAPSTGTFIVIPKENEKSEPFSNRK